MKKVVPVPSTCTPVQKTLFAIQNMQEMNSQYKGILKAPEWKLNAQPDDF